MEPRIRYARSSDGVNIAWWTQGRGRPLLLFPFPMWPLWPGLFALPEVDSFFMSLGLPVVTYPPRGTGQSDRDVADYSLEMQIKDLEAVADRLGSKRFELMGATSSSPLAIAYAARHPERVENLILWLPWASGRGFLESGLS